MSKFEIYGGYLHQKDSKNSPATTMTPTLEDTPMVDGDERTAAAIALEVGESGDASTVKQHGETHSLKSTPPAYIICQCKDENYLNVVEHDGIIMSMSYLKGSYVTSRPTGYTNLAISAAFLSSSTGHQAP